MIQVKLIYTLLLLAIVLIGCKESPESAHKDQFDQFPEITQLTQLIAENPFDPSLYFERARMYIHHEGYDEALADLNKVIQLDSSFLSAWHTKADVQLEYYKSNQALKTLEEATIQMPENIENWLKLSEFQLYLKQYADAHQSVDQVLVQSPNMPLAHFMKGMIWLEQGDTSRAVKEFKNCTQRDPYIFDAWMKLGDITYKQQKQEAANYYKAILEIEPTHEQALLGLANAHMQQAEWALAKSTYDKIIRNNSRMTDAFYNKGLLYLEQDSVELAIDHFNITTQIDPSYTQGYLYRAICHELLEEWDMANNDYENVLGLDPDNQAALDGLNRIKGNY